MPPRKVDTHVRFGVQADPMNAVEQAIERFKALRPDIPGITAAVVATGIPDRTWRRYKVTGRMPAPHCFVVADLTGISARELAGYTASTGDGGNGGRKPSKGGRSMRSTTAWSTASVADRSGESAHVTPPRPVLHGTHAV
jgi:hypothetical protein